MIHQNLRRALSITATAVALLVGAGCGGGQQHQAVAATSSPSIAATSASPTPSLTPSPTPSVSLSPTPPPKPVPAWTPCNTSLESYEGGCDNDFLGGDTCDAAYYSKQMNGVVLYQFIESKDYVNEKRLRDCPQFLADWRKAKTGFLDGAYEVGSEIKPGTYQTIAHLGGGHVEDCYWERTGTNGHIIANNFITATKKATVTIRSSDEMFTSRGCGAWIRV
ncbi:hypothetical protein ACFO0M_17180 [Micromonospora mangrovi]|uniref:Uncharacterized protein n=2 Tax=Micromonospora TaxID=1873 RepID=A0AAU8HH36_9ACTN